MPRAGTKHKSTLATLHDRSLVVQNHRRMWDNRWTFPVKLEGRLNHGPIVDEPKMDSQAVWMPAEFLAFRPQNAQQIMHTRYEGPEKDWLVVQSILFRAGANNVAGECWEWTGGYNNTVPMVTWRRLRLHPLKVLTGLLSGDLGGVFEFGFRRLCANKFCVNPRHYRADCPRVNVPLYFQGWSKPGWLPWATHEGQKPRNHTQIEMAPDTEQESGLLDILPWTDARSVGASKEFLEDKGTLDVLPWKKQGPTEG